MSDLISRSELLKKIEKYKFSAISNDAEREFIRNTIIKTIQKQPTAYNIDKVVEELESFAKLAEDRWTNGTSKHAYQEHKCWVKAIEIVKQGVIADDVCEWKQTSTAKYKTSCGYKIEEYFDTNACYCKQCGKKIKKIKESEYQNESQSRTK